MASQGIEIIRGCFGLNLIGADLVEVSPPYDTTGNTALLQAPASGFNLLFEMLCMPFRAAAARREPVPRRARAPPGDDDGHQAGEQAGRRADGNTAFDGGEKVALLEQRGLG
jgi:hypothetical protein